LGKVFSMELDSDTEFIDAKKLSLNEWLYLVFETRESNFMNCCFPSNSHEEKYIASINTRSNREIYNLIEKFLVPSTSFGIDEQRLAFAISELKKQEDPMEWLANKPYYIRLIFWVQDKDHSPPWEGITWILELLPDHPKKAINVIENYLIGHFNMLPDWRISGLFDAITLIRAKFIGTPENNRDKIRFLLELDYRQFEHLIERLYNRMGYETELTSATRDGGRDVIAIQNALGQKEIIAIECKLYNRIVGVEIVRALRGIVEYEGFNKGLLFTTHRFSEPAEQLAIRDNIIELVPGEQLIVLLNENFGIDWPLHLERIILASERSKKQ